MVAFSERCCFVEDIHKVGARSHIEAVRTRLKNQGNGVSCPKRGKKIPPKDPAPIFVHPIFWSQMRWHQLLEFLES